MMASLISTIKQNKNNKRTAICKAAEYFQKLLHETRPKDCTETEVNIKLKNWNLITLGQWKFSITLLKQIHYMIRKK